MASSPASSPPRRRSCELVGIVAGRELAAFGAVVARRTLFARLGFRPGLRRFAARRPRVRRFRRRRGRRRRARSSSAVFIAGELPRQRRHLRRLRRCRRTSAAANSSGASGSNNSPDSADSTAAGVASSRPAPRPRRRRLRRRREGRCSSPSGVASAVSAAHSVNSVVSSITSRLSAKPPASSPNMLGSRTSGSIGSTGGRASSSRAAGSTRRSSTAGSGSRGRNSGGIPSSLANASQSDAVCGRSDGLRAAGFGAGRQGREPARELEWPAAVRLRVRQREGQSLARRPAMPKGRYCSDRSYPEYRVFLPPWEADHRPNGVDPQRTVILIVENPTDGDWDGRPSPASQSSQLRLSNVSHVATMGYGVWPMHKRGRPTIRHARCISGLAAHCPLMRHQLSQGKGIP